MAAIQVYALAKPAEKDFLDDYFSDTRARILPLELREGWFLNFNEEPVFLFVDASLLPSKHQQALKRLLRDRDNVLAFFLGEYSPQGWNDAPRVIRLSLPLSVSGFEPIVLNQLTYPAEIRVLVIDDEPELCEGIKEYLESKRSAPSFRVDYALNGLEAYAKMEAFRPDVCILDLKMPVKSGHDFFREAQKRFPGFRAIILTSSVGPDEIAEIRKLGAPPFVEKGSQRSTFQELTELIKKTWCFS